MSNDPKNLAALAKLANPKFPDPFGNDFAPAVLVHREFEQLAQGSGNPVPCVVGISRPDGTCSRFALNLLPEGHPQASLNAPLVERVVKFLLWQRGGNKVLIGGPSSVAEYVADRYSVGGEQAFDVGMMGQTMFAADFEVVSCTPEEVPAETSDAKLIGRNLEGNRIGFDLGASDRKVAAVVDGVSIWSEEVDWDPRGNSDPSYHLAEIRNAINSAAEKMDSVDAIGGSSAGVIINNQVMVASLFRGVPQEKYDAVRDAFLTIASEYGVPLEVANDGDVTALAGAMSLDQNAVLGIAMGSSEAAGYVDGNGHITGWLNELAFAPIDYAATAPADEWSEDIGCGVQYLTQQAVFRLAQPAGIDISGTDQLAEKLRIVQRELEAGNAEARKIWRAIGIYCGYAIAHYAQFYGIEHMLILGRVTSGQGGTIIIETAREVLASEFPELADSISVNLPDEKTRRVGQAVAAASLPKA